MKTLKAFLLSTLIIPIALLSCSKDDDSSSSPAPAPTKSELMVGTWMTSALTVDPPIEINGTLISDYFSQLDPCTQDDIFTFNADKSYSVEEGASKCDPADAQIIEAGTWAFNTDQTIVILTSGTETSEVNLSSISSTTLVVTFTEEEAGVKYNFTQTMKKQ